METCLRCRRLVRQVNEQFLCLQCRIEIAPESKTLTPDKTTRLFVDKSRVPILLVVVHHAQTVETNITGLVLARMYCGFESKDPLHKFTFDVKEVTCSKCLDELFRLTNNL